MRHLPIITLIGLLLLNRLDGSEGTPQGVLPAPETLHGLSGANCGVNVICEAFYLTDNDHLSDVFIDNITGRSLQAHLFSLSEIGSFLLEGDLSVAAVKSCPIDVLLSQIGPKQFAIIHTNDFNGTHNHFLIISADPKMNKYDVLDFPEPKVTDDAQTLIQHYKTAFSGDGLLVSQSKTPKPDQAKIIASVEAMSDAEDKIAQNLKADAIDDSTALVNGPAGFSYQSVIKLQRDVNDVSKLIGICTLDNEGEGTVSVIRAHGACTCFQRAEGLHDISKKRILTFNVVFDADRFDKIHGSQIVLSAVIAGVNKDFLIRVIPDNPKILTSVICIPSTISFADFSDENLQKSVNIYIAGNPNKNEQPDVSTTSSFLTARITKVNTVHLNRQFMTCYSLTVNLKIPPGSAFTLKDSFVQLLYSQAERPVRLPVVLTSNL